jgi:cytochrome c5
MNKTVLKRLTQAGLAIMATSGLLALILQIPRATADDKSAGATSTTTTATSPAQSSEKVEKGGSQLWSENCARCHNMRSPSSYSDAEWEVVMQHMRVRAHLTPKEYKAILEFLKSAN